MREQGNTAVPEGDGRSTLEDFLLARSATSPVWRTPTTLAYLANETGTYQVHEVALATGASRRLTAFAEPAAMLVAAPRAKRLVFGVDAGGNERHQLWSIDGGQPAWRRTTDDAVIHQSPALSGDGRWLAYSSNARERQFFDIWVTDLDTGTSRLALAVEGWLAPLAWSPDGAAILVRRSNTNLDHDLYLVAPDGGTPRPLTPHDGEATVSAAAFDPVDGSILMATNQDGDIARLIRLDPESGRQTVLVDGAWDVEALAPAPEGSRVAYVVNEDGASRLFLYDVAAGESTPVPDVPTGVVSGLAWSPDGDRLAFAVTGAGVPSQIWIHEIGGATHPVVRSASADRLPAAPSQHETIRYPSFDGLEIPAFWFRPVSTGGGGKLPVVVYVHGGPESQLRPEYFPFTQYLADRGYAVLAPNVRGSIGYGKRYHHLDDRERRPDAVADLAAAVTWLRTQPDVDADRIAVFGRSYGGFMVLAALTSYPDLWAAGVDVVGIADFASFFERTGPWRRQMRADEYGDPERDAELLRRLSPLHKAENIVAPLIVLHGRNDPRVPVEEAEQIVRRLSVSGRDVELVVFEDEGHVFGKEANQIAAFRAIARFLDRTLA